MLANCACVHNNCRCFAIVLIVLVQLLMLDTGDCFRRNLRNVDYSDEDYFDSSCNGSVFITISSVKNSCIELNWNFANCIPNEIRLYNSESIEGVRPIAWIIPNNRKGYYVTKQQIPHDILPTNWDHEKNFNASFKPRRGPQCLNYWIVAYKNNQRIKKSCLKIQPTWMKDNGDKIGDVPLGKLMIPGTHNSGCYDDNPEAEIKIKSIDKFVYTQDKDVWTQLCFGIRYLDVRVGYYNLSSTFWVNHDKFQANPLVDILRAVKLFIQKVADEIIIIDIHRFPFGFKNRSVHNKLLALLRDELGNVTIPRSFQKNPHGPTLNELWKQKRRLIISYGDKTSAINSDDLWDPLSQQWGNVQSATNLKSFLSDARVSREPNSNPFWAAMAELTPTAATVFFGLLHPGTSLAQMADSINRNVTDWFRYEWCDTKTNIIATDYFMGNDIICVSLFCNLKNAYQWN